MSGKTQTSDQAQTTDVMPDPTDDTEIEATAVATDGSDEAQAEGQQDSPRAKTPFEEARDRATQRYRELRDAELKGGPAGDSEQAPEAEAETDLAQEVDPSEPTATAKAAAPPAAEPELEVPLIIDGKQVTKPLSEVVKLAQITVASDNRLEEAKRLLRQATAVHERAMSEHQPDDGTAKAAKPTRATDDDIDPEHQPDDVDPEELDSIVERIQVGDKDDGRQAIADLMKLVQGNTSLNERAVSNMVRQTIVQNDTKKELDEAVTKFTTAFPTIASDDDLVDVALRRVQRELRSDLVAAGISEDDLKTVTDPKQLAALHRQVRVNGAKVRTYDTLLSEVGTYLSNKFGTPREPSKPATEKAPQQPQRQPARPSTIEARTELKRSAAQQPRAAGVRGQVAQAPKPKTAAEIIREMRRARHFQ